MTTTGTASGRDWGLRDLLAGLVLVAGLAGAGSCDGCVPWHPLLIVTPLLGGFSLVQERPARGVTLTRPADQ
ncbi:MAG: hypothetical protein V5A62_09330 [Haloarculaceae archaeon]